MSCKEIKVDVNGRRYRLTEWTAEYGLIMFLKVSKEFGSLLGSGVKIDSTKKGKLEDKLSFDFKVLGETLQNISVRDIDSLFHDMTVDIFYLDNRSQNRSEYDEHNIGKKIEFNSHFSEYKEDLFPLLIQVAKVQLLPFVRKAGLSFGLTKK